jgi:serine/threonine-protein kinase RsbW
VTAEYHVPSADTTPACLGLLGAGWPYREANLCRPVEVGPFLKDVTAALAGLGYSPHDQFSVHLALEEAIVNGLRHGNGGDPTKRVQVRYRADAEALLAEVLDEGPGFDPDTVPDPTLPENRERPGGRGLLLMRHVMTWVCFHGCGNRVTLCKRPTAPPHPSR